MGVKIKYIGWTAFELTTEKGIRILIDPLLAGRPDDGIAPSAASIEDFDDVQLVLVTHTASDHVGQAFEIIKRSEAKLVCDVATRFRAMEEAGISQDRIYQMVSGVQFVFDDVSVKALHAQHISFSRIKDGFINAQPLSYIISISTGEKIFFAGDTSIHGDLKLFGDIYQPHIAMLGVGGVDVHGQSLVELYPWEAALAARWLGVQKAIPMHYRFQEGEEFIKELQRRAPSVEGLLMKPGEETVFSPKG